MSWKLILTWITRFKSFFTTGIIHDFMESSHKQKELIKNAKVRRKVTKVDFTLKPFNLKVRKVIVYDDFDKVELSNKQLDITLEKRVEYIKKQ